MTQKHFWNDPYQTVIDTRVASVADDIVRLRETVFFAFSGGQESDTGTIGGNCVLEARTAGLDIDYRLTQRHGLQPGDPVRVEIDWDRRYRLMRLHFAAELVLEVAYRQLVGAEKIGAHIAAEKARIDFAWPESIGSTIWDIATEAQKVIDRDLEILSAFSDEESQIRYWQVEGFARVPCGGTHLERTGEVGEIRLKRKNIGKGKERIEVYLDSS